MCGIYGGLTRHDASIMKRMGKMIAHRGPDDAGNYQEEGLYLGHQRLSIIDLDTGHQPMIAPDRRHVIVYNGEIYNFKEIKKELLGLGHQFTTTSDTEVILASYREWGKECLHHFNGMFAFALWDCHTKQLWLVRDRIGKKPLYYMKTKDAFYFASEAKALWVLPDFEPRYDAKAIDQYLTYRYVPSNRTLFENISKVPPGHWMLVDGDGTFKTYQWWKLPEERDEGQDSSAPSKFEELFRSAVNLRLVSDVPVGIFLSSGIDSASIALETSKTKHLTAISLGFGEKTDELDITRQIAQQLKSPYIPYVLQKQDFAYFQAAVSAFDEPYGDPIILPTYILSRIAKQHVKVVLTGDGADEILANYVHHDYFRKYFGRLPSGVDTLVAGALRLVPASFLSGLMNYPAAMGSKGKARLIDLLKDKQNLLAAYNRFVSIFSPEDKEHLYSSDFANEVAGGDPEYKQALAEAMQTSAKKPLDRVMRFDMTHWFAEQTLMKLDRLGMANSLEGRCPYADYRLIEFFAEMPFAAFEQLSKKKKIVRDIYQNKIAAVQKKKQAFYMPMDNVFRQSLHDLVGDMFQSSDFADCGWFDKNHVESLLQNRHRSPLLMDKQIMSLVILMMWRRGAEKIIKERGVN